MSDKSRSFDTLIGIYSIALEPEDVVRASQIADELREAGNKADIAARNWEILESDLPTSQEVTECLESFPVYSSENLRRVKRSGDVSINWGDEEERVKFLFCYNLLSVADDISRISSDMLRLSNSNYNYEALDRSRFFSRLARKSNGSENARSYKRHIEEDSGYLGRICEIIEENGVGLVKFSEFDSKAAF